MFRNWLETLMAGEKAMQAFRKIEEVLDRIFTPGAGSTLRRHSAGFPLAALVWRASGALATWSPPE